jgi:leader peptidase (prepilin peptidase)/N-methyltransferase
VTIAVVCIAGAFGLAVGSFLNVVLYRVPRGESLTNPPSRCPLCGNQIRWRENIPVASWILLRGKCRTCGSPISVRYPLIEAATALVFVTIAFLLV